MSIKANERDPESFSVQLDRIFCRMDRPQQLWPGGFLPYKTYERAWTDLRAYGGGDGAARRIDPAGETEAAQSIPA
jgi:hypothetical protein